MPEIARTPAGTPLDDGYMDDTCAPRCQRCAGEGFEECSEFDCWERDCNGDTHICPDCGGSGMRGESWHW